MACRPAGAIDRAVSRGRPFGREGVGLSIPLVALVTSPDLLIGLAIAALLIVVVRPVLVGALLLPVRLQRSERIFVLWAGLKGAVPILLGLFILESSEPDCGCVF